MIWAFHTDQDLVIGLVLLDTFLEETVEDVSQRLYFVYTLHLVHALLLLPLA